MCLGKLQVHSYVRARLKEDRMYNIYNLSQVKTFTISTV